MKILNVLLILSLISFASCSSKGKKMEAKEEQSVTNLEEDSDFIVDAEDDQLIAEEPAIEETVEEIAPVEESVASVDQPMVEATGGVANYTVKKGDTLMIIAFNIWGDYRKWKDLQASNGISGTGIKEGMVLSYQKPAEEFVWNPQGLPYLIKRGDSLGSISKDKYGTTTKWKAIYENNQPLIRDPNLIFAGFTIHYTPERDLASE